MSRRAGIGEDPDEQRQPAGPPVLLIGNFLSGVGGRRGVCEELAARLRDAGWRVRTASEKEGRVGRLADMLWRVWSWRREYAVCHVDVFSGPAFLWAAAVTWLLGRLRKPYVLSLRGGRLPEFASRWPWLVRQVLAGAAVVTVPSEYLLREMRPYRSDLLLLSNPLALEAYPFEVRARPRPMLIWLRAFHEVYNPSMAPCVLSILAPEFPEVSLTMIGPDKQDGSLARTRAKAETLRVSDRLQIILGVEKTSVPDALSGADIFLNTTNVDNTPVSVMEAMACGLCVVSTDVGGVPDLLEDGTDALLVPPGRAEAMAAAVRRILTESTLAKKLSTNARRKVERYDWSSILPQWEKLLCSAVSAHD